MRGSAFYIDLRGDARHRERSDYSPPPRRCALLRTSVAPASAALPASAGTPRSAATAASTRCRHAPSAACASAAAACAACTACTAADAADAAADSASWLSHRRCAGTTSAHAHPRNNTYKHRGCNRAAAQPKRGGEEKRW